MIHLDVLAGKMTFDGKKVSPDQRKGILRVVIDPNQDLVEVQWLDRTNEPPVVENRWTSPVTIELVPSAKTGKVYVLKPEIGEKQFVWIQQQSSNSHPDAADFAASHVDNLEALINQIQMFAQMRSGHDAAEMYAQIFGTGQEDDHQAIVDLGHHGIDHEDEDEGDDVDMEELVEHLMSSGDVEDLNQLAVILLMQPEIQQEVIAQFVLMAANYLAANPNLLTQPVTEEPKSVDVSSVIQSEEAIKVYQDDELIKARLLALCPENENDIVSVIRSPQFGEAMRSLTEGIYSEQISLLFASLGLDPTTISGDPFEALCKALEDKHKNK
jgi:hypothetical protein